MKSWFWTIYNHIWDGAAVLMLAAMFVAVTLQVIMRYVFNAPLAWTEEMSRYTFIWMAWLGGAIAMRERKLITIDLIDQIANPAFRTAVDLFQKLVSTGVLVIYIYFGYMLVLQNIRYKAIVSRMNMGLINACIPVGAVGMLVYLYFGYRKRMDKGGTE